MIPFSFPAAASLLLATQFLVGCASIPMADPLKSAEAKKFQPKPGLAQIYVCRDYRFFAGGRLWWVELDKKPLGTMAQNTFAYAEVEPGKHTVVAKAQSHDSVLNFSIGRGEQKFFQTWPTFVGFAPIEEISAESGKECVSNAEMVAPSSYDYESGSSR